MAEPLNPDPSIPRYLFIVVVLAGVAILFFIVVPILLHLPDRIGRWFWKEDDWVGISRRREFADGRHVSIFDVPTWARRLSLHRRPIDRRLAGKRKIDKIVHSHWRIPWIPGGKVMPAEPRLIPGLEASHLVSATSLAIFRRLRIRLALPAPQMRLRPGSGRLAA